MMYKAFYKGGGHASVMDEIKLIEIFFFANLFLLHFFKPQIQRVSFIKSLFTHRITPPFFADNKILKQDAFLVTASIEQDTKELMKGPNITFDNVILAVLTCLSKTVRSYTEGKNKDP